MNSNPQPPVNSFEVSPFSPAFLHSLQLGMRNSPPQIANCLQPHHNLCTIFSSPHHYLCCTSLQIDCTSPQSLLHLTTGPHHRVCCTSPRSLLHLTTVFAVPHHRSALTTDPNSPQSLLHLTTNFTAPTNSNLAYRNPTPALQKLVVISSN